MSNPACPATNFLIESLPQIQRGRILSRCTVEELQFGNIVCDVNEAYQHVYFPLNGFISLIAVMEGHPPFEVGLVGNEGMLGISLALGVNVAPMQSMVQGSGSVLKISIADFENELKTDTEFRTLINRYIYILMQQLTQSSLCIHYHEIEARLARWLLMTQDRAHKDSFLLTHVFLAHMLGVRRSGVSLAAIALRKKNLIDYTRGEITVLDRPGLESTSCACYKLTKDAYSRVLVDS